MKHLSVIILCVFFFAGKQSSAQNFSFADAKWLLGKWENQTQRGKMVEEWTMANDSTYTGRSYMITATDSVSLESVVLKKEGSDVYYIPTVKGQNNEQAVRFKLTSRTTRSMVFENPAHDFPQKISYTQTDDTSLTAEISGLVNGTMRARQFPMKKVKDK